MFSFLSEFTREVDRTRRVIVMDDDGLSDPRRYRVNPRSLLLGLGLAGLAIGLVLAALLVLTPLRSIVPGLSSAELEQQARVNEIRLRAVEDSLAAQDAYLTHLRNLMLGRIEPESDQTMPPPDIFALDAADYSATPSEPSSENWEDHAQPALPFSRLDADGPSALPAAADRYVSSLRFPVQPPVRGLLTRGFDARSGHYAVDIAVENGTLVRAIGDGYVILADWTHDGGHVLAVQHADGFVSVYKHNAQLLKRAGDRVLDREGIALSGNTGEVTTGPHVHFELWYDGLAQDPSGYMIR